MCCHLLCVRYHPPCISWQRLLLAYFVTFVFPPHVLFFSSVNYLIFFFSTSTLPVGLHGKTTLVDQLISISRSQTFSNITCRLRMWCIQAYSYLLSACPLSPILHRVETRSAKWSKTKTSTPYNEHATGSQQTQSFRRASSYHVVHLRNHWYLSARRKTTSDTCCFCTPRTITS